MTIRVTTSAFIVMLYTCFCDNVHQLGNLCAVVLKAVWMDPLTQAGGLLHVSEMGRHLSSNQLPGPNGADIQQGLHGNSDDGDLDHEHDDLSDLSDSSDDDEAIQHGAGFIIGQQLAVHPVDHFAGPLDPHDHDGEYPGMYD